MSFSPQRNTAGKQQIMNYNYFLCFSGGETV